MGWAQSPRHQRPITQVVRMDDINHGNWILFDTRHARLRPGRRSAAHVAGELNYTAAWLPPRFTSIMPSDAAPTHCEPVVIHEPWCDANR